VLRAALGTERERYEAGIAQHLKSGPIVPELPPHLKGTPSDRYWLSSEGFVGMIQASRCLDECTIKVKGSAISGHLVLEMQPALPYQAARLAVVEMKVLEF
jgi:hypothetical protein